jgi:methionyl-tRNA formyltransferase
VGVLLDSLSVRVWQRHILDFIISHPSFEITAVILNDSLKPAGGKKKYIVYKFFTRLDRKIFKTKTNLFALRPAPDILRSKVIAVKPKQNKSTDEIIEHDLAAIRNHELDIIIRFGFRILKGRILSAARLGVWSLHHGDNDVNRGGPPAFWEVVNGEHVTGVTLLKLSSDLDGGTVLGKSFATTDRTSFHRNQTSVYWAGIELFCSSLDSLASKGEEFLLEKFRTDPTTRFYFRPLYRNPTNLSALKIFLKFWMRRSKEFLMQIIYEQQWSLYYHPLRENLETSLFRYKNLKPPKGVDWADPFVISVDDTTYVFFEEFIRKEKKAHISMFQLNAKGELKSRTPARILNEPYHLSYPYIAEANGKLYLTVESAEANKVTLYECEKFPDVWVMKKDIFDNIRFYDPTLFYHEGLWYLFGNIKPWEGNSANQYLAIYYTDDLVNGTWKPHALNPISRDVRGARPAGRIQEYKGRILRPSQIGAPKYGYGIKFHEIVTLTPTEFVERPAEEILPLWDRGLLATHTCNFDQKFLFVDGQKRRFF